MSGCEEQMLDKVILIRPHALHAAAAAFLTTVRICGQPFNIPVMRQCNHRVFTWNLILVFNRFQTA